MLYTALNKKGPMMTEAKMNYAWTVDKISKFCADSKTCRKSPTFYSGIKKKYEWHLSINMFDFHNKSQGYIGIGLHSNWLEIGQEHFVARISILGFNEKKYGTKTVFITDKDVYIKHFMQKTVLLNNPSLTISNQIKVSCEIFNLSESNKETSLLHPASFELEMQKKLYNDRKFCDVTIITKEKEIKAHKMILANQSSIFNEMFHENENIERTIHVNDVEHKVMETMLEFMYTGKINVENLDSDMLKASDKFKVHALKEECEAAISKNLSVENIYNILQLADQCNAAMLKERALDFFEKNLKSIKKLPNFHTAIMLLPENLRKKIATRNTIK